MPLTCSHPAAILPFRRFKALNLAALIIGSMSPDTGYFLGLRYFAKLAHRPEGAVLLCIPTGLILLALFYLLRRELCYILPSPHRNQLTPLAHKKPDLTGRALLTAAISILIGAWTHIIWDQFTHDGSFLVRHFSPLQTVLGHIGSSEITLAYTLQYVSTFFGAAVLVLAYLKWLRTQPTRPDNESDAWRYLLWFSLGLFALTVGAAIAKHMSAPVHEFKTLREFVYKMGVSAVSVFTLLIVTSGILVTPAVSRPGKFRTDWDAPGTSHGTGQKCKNPNVYAGCNDVTAQPPWKGGGWPFSIFHFPLGSGTKRHQAAPTRSRA